MSSYVDWQIYMPTYWTKVGFKTMKEIWPQFARKKVLLRQDNARVHSFLIALAVSQINLRIAPSSAIFSKFKSQWLCPVFKHKEMASQILFFGRDIKVGETLDKVYKDQRRLCWKLKPFFPKKLSFVQKDQTHWTAHVILGILVYLHW